MKGVRPEFEFFEVKKEDLPRKYQKLNCLITWDVKLGENFWWKARQVAGGHVTEALLSITYSCVETWDFVIIALTFAALNELLVLNSDIKNTYLTADCRVRVYTVAGAMFRDKEVWIMVIMKSIYGHQSSWEVLRSKLAIYFMNIITEQLSLTKIFGYANKWNQMDMLNKR